MSFGYAKAKHKEAGKSHLDHVEWSLDQAKRARASGKCSLAIDYAVEAIKSAGAFAAHTVASDIRRDDEQHDLQVARVHVVDAKRIIGSCCGRR